MNLGSVNTPANRGSIFTVRSNRGIGYPFQRRRVSFDLAGQDKDTEMKPREVRTLKRLLRRMETKRSSFMRASGCTAGGRCLPFFFPSSAMVEVVVELNGTQWLG